MFKLKLHLYFLISEYYIATTKHHARQFHRYNNKLQKWVEKLNKLLLEGN